jgi:hypothetical protein
MAKEYKIRHKISRSNSPGGTRTTAVVYVCVRHTHTHTHTHTYIYIYIPQSMGGLSQGKRRWKIFSFLFHVIHNTSHIKGNRPRSHSFAFYHTLFVCVYHKSARTKLYSFRLKNKPKLTKDNISSVSTDDFILSFIKNVGDTTLEREAWADNPR